MKRLALVLVALAGFACAPVKGAGPCPLPTGHEIAAAANVDRQRAGLTPVQWDAELADIATDWARQATEENPHRSSYPPSIEARFLSVAENTWGPRLSMCVDAAEVERTFMASPSHAGAILYPAMDLIGVGVVAHEKNVWIVQNLGDLR